MPRGGRVDEESTAWLGEVRVVDRAGRHALHVGIEDDRVEHLIDVPPRLQERAGVAVTPELWARDLEVASLGGMSVAAARAPTSRVGVQARVALNGRSLCPSRIFVPVTSAETFAMTWRALARPTRCLRLARVNRTGFTSSP